MMRIWCLQKKGLKRAVLCIISLNQVDQFFPAIYDEEVDQTLYMMVDNDVQKLSMYSTYGDGTEIQLEYINEIIRILDEITIPVHWQRGTS